MSGKQTTIAKFMKELSSVEGFPLEHDTLQEFAHKIPAETGVKPTKPREKPRAKTVYNKWCAQFWKAFCLKEYGRTLPLADQKYTDGENKGQVKLSAQTVLRRQMWEDFQQTDDFQILQAEVDSENQKLGNIPSKKKKETQTDQIKRLKKELEQLKKESSSDESQDESQESPPQEQEQESPPQEQEQESPDEFDRMDTN